ncbi:MAG TPA: hypothetical protein VMJ10_10710 [Kofleriaceae bacterium]|nr:hypothetical protein [Kofleriaceae bacterium]
MRQVVVGAVAIAASATLTVGIVRSVAPPEPACESPAVARMPAPTPQASPPPFDALACELAHRGPPPASAGFVLHDAHALAAAARAIAAALPRAWRAHVELDATGMAKLVELHFAGTRSPTENANTLLDLVRAHPCLFGVVAPAALVAKPIGSNEHALVYFDSRGFVTARKLGTLYASLDVEGGGLHVVLERHLWPVIDREPAIDPARMLARYLGHTYGEHGGYRMRLDPSTHEPRACEPMVSNRIAELASFRWRAEPILACRGDHADVVYGARVDLHGAMRRDPVLAELPTALMPDGTPVPEPRIAPAGDVEGVGFLHDLGECPPSPKPDGDGID